MTIHKVIAGNLLRARRDRDITQEQLALKIGLSQNWVKKCESGNEKINLDYLVSCSRALNCSLHELIPENYKEEGVTDYE